MPLWTPPATDGETETADQNSGLVDLHSKEREGKGSARGDRPMGAAGRSIQFRRHATPPPFLIFPCP